MKFTDEEAPDFDDKFHKVTKMLLLFNLHCKQNYIPFWLSCLDKSMNLWLDKYCPGFMHVPRKPHPFGNEFHIICNGDQGRSILWHAELVEGKDHPLKANGMWAFSCELKHASISKTAALMLCTTQPVHRKGKVVMMDSGFCVAVGIVELHKCRVFGQLLIKTHCRYWPKYVPGNKINNYFVRKELGETHTYEQEVDSIKYLIHCTRYDCYVSKIMSSHGILDEIQYYSTGCKVGGQLKSFKNLEPISHHNLEKHWVDDHNNCRHDLVGLDQTWCMKWWPTQQFSFLVANAEVNTINSWARATKALAEPTLEFCKQLVEKMIHNKLNNNGNVVEEVRVSTLQKTRGKGNEHALTCCPLFHGKWDLKKKNWAKTKQKYQKVCCNICGFKCRTFCSCDRSETLYDNCFADHKPKA